MDHKYLLFGDLMFIRWIFDICVGMKRQDNIYVQKSILNSDGCFDIGDRGRTIIRKGDIIVVLNDDEYRKIKEKAEIHNPIFNLELWLGNALTDEIRIRPKLLSIDASTLCQLDCVDCYMRKRNYDGVGKGSLKIETLKNIVDRYPYVREMELSNNGEALLAPDFVPILEFLCERNIGVTLYNGVNLNTASDELIEAIVKYGVKGMTVSIDGATQEVYEKYRRNGHIERVLENVKKINEYKSKYKVETPNIIWQYILMEHNECDVCSAKKMAKSMNMQIQFKRTWGKYNPVKIEALKKETGLKELTRTDNYPWGDRCLELLFQPHINWDGMLLGCCSSHRMNFGINVIETGVENAINSMIYRECMRDVFIRNKKISKKTPCGNCDIYLQHLLK